MESFVLSEKKIYCYVKYERYSTMGNENLSSETNWCNRIQDWAHVLETIYILGYRSYESNDIVNL